jgi:hypothetical protein
MNAIKISLLGVGKINGKGALAGKRIVYGKTWHTKINLIKQAFVDKKLPFQLRENQHH